jgi:hypothetical protein
MPFAPVIQLCNFYENTVATTRALLYGDEYGMSVNNCIFNGNGKEIAMHSTPSEVARRFALLDCVFSGNIPSPAGGFDTALGNIGNAVTASYMIEHFHTYLCPTASPTRSRSPTASRTSAFPASEAFAESRAPANSEGLAGSRAPGNSEGLFASRAAKDSGGFAESRAARNSEGIGASRGFVNSQEFPRPDSLLSSRASAESESDVQAATATDVFTFPANVYRIRRRMRNMFLFTAIAHEWAPGF